MNTREETIWKSLLAQSAPTFAGDLAPPLGLTSRVLAGMREARMQEAAWERVGLRAIFASLVAVAALAVITVAGVPHHDDVDMPVRNLAVLEHVQIA